MSRFYPKFTLFHPIVFAHSSLLKEKEELITYSYKLCHIYTCVTMMFCLMCNNEVLKKSVFYVLMFPVKVN